MQQLMLKRERVKGKGLENFSGCTPHQKICAYYKVGLPNYVILFSEIYARRCPSVTKWEKQNQLPVKGKFLQDLNIFGLQNALFIEI